MQVKRSTKVGLKLYEIIEIDMKSLKLNETTNNTCTEMGH